jgi:threonine/homoserine/homoserine lactone efflux protein
VAYLLYLAWQSFKEKEKGFIINENKPLEYRSLYKKGILMNLLNPKVSLFFLALLPQFVNKSIGHITLQMFILGIIFLVQALVIFVVVSVFSEKLRHFLLTNSFIAKRMNVIKGSLLAVIGIQIAFSEK